MLISVCIPAMRSATVRSAIESIRRQSWTQWELIVVGQGHDTSIRAVVHDAGRSDPRVRYGYQPGIGLSRARNTGIAAARGEIIAMTDDDCDADQEWLATLANCFQREPDVGLIGGSLLRPNFG